MCRASSGKSDMSLARSCKPDLPMIAIAQEFTGVPHQLAAEFSGNFQNSTKTRRIDEVGIKYEGRDGDC
jgi:hypothetical protein